VALFVAVLGNGSIEKRTVDLPSDADEVTLATAAAHLSHHAVDNLLASVPAVPVPDDPHLGGVVSAVADAVAQHTDVDPEQVFVGGASLMAKAFDAVESVRSVLAILEQQLVVVTLLRDVLDRGLNVAIGTETGMQPLADCSIVVAPYEVEGEPVGSIGVLGPTRMNYPLALAAVAVVSNRLGRRLSEG
jgi:heat-inducible transcriptional repressor